MKMKLLTMVLLLAASTLLAQTAAEKRKRYEAYRSRLSRGALEIGSVAPDLTLPRLKTTKTADGKLAWSASDQTVTLSKHFGKQIVVLFSSSYT